MASARTGRRTHSLSPVSVLLPLALLLFASTASAASAVLGIDLGTNFIKAAIVKPGTPLDIVLTKDSKRKEASVVAFKPSSDGPVALGSFPERLYGGDAVALAGRFPGDVYSNLKPLLGIAPSDAVVVDEYQSRFPAIKINVKDKSSVSFKSGAFSDKEQPWTVEELLAMELKNIRANAEVMTGKGSKITDAVITVPAFYTADERKAIIRAADLAGLSVMGLISDGLAVGVDYSVKREFPNVSRGGKAELHLIYDMGASSTTATIVRFQSRDVKDVGKYNKTIHEVAVLGAGWDRTLGGNALNGIVLDHLVSEFEKKSEVKSAGISARDVKSHGRTASKLWREAERARQVLSANSDVRSSFEGLYNDIDFATKLSRTQFEELAQSFADRVEGPVKQALEAAKINIEDLTSVILHGGAIRTPFVQKRLEAIFGKAVEIRSNVNADESAAFGAAFKAARLSPSFRVKEIRDTEAAIYPAGIVQTQAGKDRQQQIFVPTSGSATPKQVQFKDKTDFDFNIYQKIDDTVRPIAKIETKNLTAGVKALNEKFGCSAEDVQTKFVFRLSPIDGSPELVNGVLTCSVEGSGKKGGVLDSVKGLFGGKKDQEPLKADESASSSASAASSEASPAASSANTTKTETANKGTAAEIRVETMVIDFTASHQGLPVPSKEEHARMVERLAAFDRSDKARLLREEAFNTLESLTYRARDLLGDTDFEGFSTEAVRSKLSSTLSSTSDWLYGEGSTATSEVLKAKLKELRDLIDPVQKRKAEAAARPEKIKLLQKALDSTKQLVDNISDQVSKAALQASSAAAEAASSAASAVKSESSDAADDLDDLEEAEASTSSTAKPSTTAPFSPYSTEDLVSIKESYDSVASWLTERLALQEKLPAYEDAALSLKEIEAKAESLNRAMVSLVQKQIRIPKKTPSKKSKASKATKKAKSSASSAASSVSSGASSAASAASSAVSSGASSVGSVASSAASSLGSAASSGASSITSAASSAASDAASQAKTIELPGGKDGNPPSHEEIMQRLRDAGVNTGEGQPPHDEL